ncbi:zinc-binding alcohol dehydrogenase [Pueribacillus theae]|uniref:Zinc-binding alcohol dehydrogenase n=1 Tax=Pueribacillus theae TaxID=2171751 RepID=A0A2U1JIJ9_9BACI|nr:zinc-binding dehydrogenase [Pueribacillus theae]PWA04990.1 zinc-binding alcohol dehydrogenase [Pueribacillus theae]
MVLKKIGRVAVMMEPEKLRYQEYEVPEPENGAVVLRVLRTNICGSELHIWKGLHPTKKRGVLGHEMIGELYAAGKGVETDYAGNPIKKGDRIVAAYYLTCRKCTPCKEGKFHLCEHAYDFWNQEPEKSPHFHGTFATHYYIHPNQYFYKVPDNVSDVSAASANCALSQVYFGIEKAQLTNNQSIIIQGAGGLGLNATAVAKEKGATVIVIDGVESRLEQAKQFGADYVLNFNDFETMDARTNAVLDLTGGKGAHVGMELSGNPAAFAEGIHFIRPGGKYVSIGNVTPGKFVEFDPGLLTRKSIQIIPLVRYDPWYLYKSLQFLSKNNEKYPFDKMLDAEFTLDEIKTALDKSAAREVTRATIVVNEKGIEEF